MMKTKTTIWILTAFLLVSSVLGFTEGQPYKDLNISSPEQIISYSDEVTGGLVMVAFMMAFNAIVFIILKKQGNSLSSTLAFSTFSTLIVSVFPWAMGYLEGDYLVVWLVLVILSLLYSLADNR